MAACHASVQPADAACLVQAAPRWCNKLVEAKETAPVNEQDDEKACPAVGRFTAQVSWQPGQDSAGVSAIAGIAADLHLHGRQPAHLKAGLCFVQDLSEDELRKVFTSGLHLPEWAALRLVSKRWKALVNSSADCVNVGLTVAELAPHTEGMGQHRSGEECLAQQEECAKAAFSRLCYVL